MNSLTAAEEYLLSQIQQGDQSGWSDFIARYQGRLLAFAGTQLRDAADADDVVQETFIGFVQKVNSFERKSSVETFLFTILRRRIIDLIRKRGSKLSLAVCSISDIEQESTPTVPQPATSDALTASSYVRLTEDQSIQRDALWTAIDSTVDSLKQKQRLRDLQVFDLLFFAQARNQQIAEWLDMDEKQVALQKFRLLKRLSQQVRESLPDPDTEVTVEDDILIRLWHEFRPTCPKRSTIGQYMLSTLDSEWHDYVDRHLNLMHCQFCLANLEDMKRDKTEPVNQQFFQSSIGFLKDGLS